MTDNKENKELPSKDPLNPEEAPEEQETVPPEIRKIIQTISMRHISSKALSNPL